jgi:tRNA 2-thiouridine synthesizing protein A
MTSASRPDGGFGADAADYELDLRGLKCPLPTLKTRAALMRLQAGQSLGVAATDPMAAIDIPHLAAQLGDELIEATQHEGILRFVIRRRARLR